MVFGQYQTYGTDRYFSAAQSWADQIGPPPSRANREGLFSHWWLLESLTATIPSSTTAAHDELLIIDPTRGQFDQKRPLLAHVGDRKYYPDAPGRSSRDAHHEWNRWLWSETELLAWRHLIKGLNPTK